MSFQEQPDRFGRAFVIALGVWSGLAMLVWFTLAHAFVAPEDAVKPVMATESACSTSSTEPLAILRAYLDGAELDAKPGWPPPVVDAALRSRGSTLFGRHCAGCHGATGDGNGPKARPLWAIHPAVLKAGVYELRTTEHEALPTDEDLFRTITRGVHGTAMPPWILLPERDRWALVAHVKTLSKQFAEDEAPPPIARGPAPDPTPARLARGRVLYQERGCVSCHGERGHGDGPAAVAFAVSPRDLTSTRFHRGSSAVDIHTTLVTGLDGTPMASFAKVMTPEELWNVAIYVHGLAPRFVERSGMRCPVSATAPADDELAGLRNLMSTLRPVPALAWFAH